MLFLTGGLSSAIVPMVLVVAGLSLAIAPLRMARFANRLRFVPYSDHPANELRYRRSGVAIAVVGAVITLFMSI